MTQTLSQDHISKKKVVYSMPGMDAVTVRRAGDIDLYYPPESQGRARTPVVIFVTGFPDAGAQRMLGCKFKEMGSYVSWAQLVATSGMVAVTYSNTDPSDIHAVLRRLREDASTLGIDGCRIAVWSCSGNVPNALSLLMADACEELASAVLCYPYTLDIDGSSEVADAARQFGFVTPCKGKSVGDLRRDVPLFIARAGQDQMPGLNDALDRFTAAALACNLPVTLVNHPEGPHAFDLFDHSKTSREIIRRILGFMRFHLILNSAKF